LITDFSGFDPNLTSCLRASLSVVQHLHEARQLVNLDIAIPSPSAQTRSKC